MKNRKIVLLLSIAIFISLLAVTAFGQTTLFTYQGKLTEAGSPATGSYQMQFKLFEAFSGGVQIGLPITDLPVTATQGIFTVKLDFGVNALSGANRWLEIAVRRNSDESYVTLSPREQIASSPYSVRTLSAANADVATNALNLGGLPAVQFVQTNDNRLTDDRNPLPGSGHYIQNTTTQQTASPSNFNIAGTGIANILEATTQFNISGNRILASTGTGNLFAGFGAGGSNSSGANNSFFGSNTGNVNTTGQFNSSFGASAGRFNSTSNHNSFFGYVAGASTTSGGNSYFGSLAGSGGFSLDTGGSNSFFGYRSGQFISTGSHNAFFGAAAGANNSVGAQNAFFGSDTGLNNTGGSRNSFYGYNAGLNNTNGVSNAFFGHSAGMNATGNLNVFLGRNAGRDTTSGPGNVFIGADTGLNNTTGRSNTVIGDLADLSSSNSSFQTVIGAGSVGNGSRSITLGRADGSDEVIVPGSIRAGLSVSGRASNNQGAVYALNSADGPGLYASSNTGYAAEFAGTGSILVRGVIDLMTYVDGGSTVVCRSGNRFANCSSSIRYKFNVQPFTSGLELVDRLRPVSYNWKSDGKPDVGFIAEEVAGLDPRFGTRNERGEIEGLKYDRLTTVLVNAIKEQQKQIENLQQQITALEKLICSQSAQPTLCDGRETCENHKRPQRRRLL